MKWPEIERKVDHQTQQKMWLFWKFGFGGKALGTCLLLVASMTWRMIGRGMDTPATPALAKMRYARITWRMLN